jgi:hypothetical protein
MDIQDAVPFQTSSLRFRILPITAVIIRLQCGRRPTFPCEFYPSAIHSLDTVQFVNAFFHGSDVMKSLSVPIGWNPSDSHFQAKVKGTQGSKK